VAGSLQGSAAGSLHLWTKGQWSGGLPNTAGDAVCAVVHHWRRSVPRGSRHRDLSMPLMTIYGADADRAGRSPGSGASIEAAFGVPDCIIRYPHPAHKFPLDLHAKLMSHQRGLVRWRQVGVAARGGIIGATMACLSPGGRGLLRLSSRGCSNSRRPIDLGGRLGQDACRSSICNRPEFLVPMRNLETWQVAVLRTNLVLASVNQESCISAPASLLPRCGRPPTGVENSPTLRWLRRDAPVDLLGVVSGLCQEEFRASVRAGGR